MKRTTYVCLDCQYVTRAGCICPSCNDGMYPLKQNAPKRGANSRWKKLRKFIESRPWWHRHKVT